MPKNVHDKNRQPWNYCPNMEKTLMRNQRALLDIFTRMIASKVERVDVRFGDGTTELVAEIKLVDLKDYVPQEPPKDAMKKESKSVDLCEVDDDGNVTHFENKEILS